MTPSERQGLVLEAVVRFAQASGCCADDGYSGQLCAYHQGMLDGMLMLLAELEQLGDARRDTDEWMR